MSARYWHSFASQPGSLDPQNYLSTATIRTWWNTSVTYTDTHTFSPTLLNTALFGFNRTIGPATQVRPEKGFADLGSKIYNDDLKQIYVAVSGYFTMNTGDTNTFYRDEYQFSDTIRWTRGRHQLTFGGEYGKGFGDIVNNFRADGRFSFNGSAPFTGESLADLMVGKFQNFTQGIGEYKNTRFNIFSLFFQDSMRLTRRLTVDLGMRWDPYFPYTDLLGRVAAWRPGQQSTRYINAPRGVLYAGDPGLSPGGFNRVWNNFGPRAGFAWDVFGNGKTSLRGGYGIFFDRQNTIATNPQANQGPFGTVVSLDGNNVNSMTDPYAGATNPFPAPLNPPSDVKFVLPHNAVVWEEHMRNPYLQAFNLTLEREVAAGFIARIAYAGSKGTRLNATRELNPAVYAPGATTATTNQRRPLFPNGFGNINLSEPTSNSTFHSLQLTAERRFSKGFTLLANYMFSKSLDDGSDNKYGPNRTNPYNQRYDKGPSDFDHTHVLTASSLWQLPIPVHGRVTQLLIGGWNLTGILTLQSGFPFTVGSGVDNARTGTGGQRAEVIGNPYFSGDRSRGEQVAQWLNKAAFAPNALGAFGSQGRNIFRGPGLASLDLGLHKNFKVRERLTTQFRFEAFNALNRPNLNGPTTSLNSGNFMLTTSTGPFEARILQFALRVMW
ncbi:MAG: hypothetical protein HY238_03680 [Acidobacteria bacterium]|nr:hypothetical protein [Acidobacteriota bacterium]